jgi:Tfp pilus assembly protein PilF
MDFGNLDSAEVECRKAVELDPISVTNNAVLTEVYWFRHEGDRALEQAQKALDIDPSNAFAIQSLANAYEAVGDHRKEVDQWVKLSRLQGQQVRANEELRAFEKGGYSAFLRTDIRFDEADGSYHDAAGDYAQLGDKDAAFAALEKMFSGRTGLSAPTPATPTCCAEWGCHSDRWSKGNRANQRNRKFWASGFNRLRLLWRKPF